MLSKFLYNLFLVLFALGVRIASVWNSKARKWVSGRKNVFTDIENELARLEDTAGHHEKWVWMHCASLGEFEQGRPLLEQIKSGNPAQKIILTFFSPSGYELMKDYREVDLVFYLPLDSAKNAEKFLDLVKPALVLWVKYEFWYYYLSGLKARNIPTILVSGIFRQRQPFFSWYGKIWQKMLSCFSQFFVQNEDSKQLLHQLGYSDNVAVIGDTRFDRVLEIAAVFEQVPYIEEFCASGQVVVAGSTWEEDEIELLHFVNVHQQIKFIIAPHEVNRTNLKDVKEEFPRSLFYSELVARGQSAGTKTALPNVLIIDNLGMLSRLYKYADVAYIGGGFGADGVHNVLEAAVYGKPVVFGPVYEKFEEAIGLIRAGGAKSIDGPINLEKVLHQLLQDHATRKEMGEKARAFVKDHEGASKKITEFIQENRLLTS